MAAEEPKAATSLEQSDDEEAENDLIREEERKAKSEAYLTSGCGYGNKKQKLVNTFWSLVWPQLVANLGWKKVRVGCKIVHLGDRTGRIITAFGSIV